MAKHKQRASMRPLKEAPSVDMGNSVPTKEIVIDDVPRETLLFADKDYKADESPRTHGFYITVIHPFNHYKKGDRVREFDAIQKIIDSGHIRFCCKTVV